MNESLDSVDQRRRKDDGWHVGKAIDVSHILTTICMVIAGFWFVSGMKTDIEVLKSKDQNDRELIKEIRADIKEIKDLLWQLKN